jgi:50S ribosomal subunit-associated GTPase HflX
MTVLGEMLEKNLPVIVAFNKIDTISENQLKMYQK